MRRFSNIVACQLARRNALSPLFTRSITNTTNHSKVILPSYTTQTRCLSDDIKDTPMPVAKPKVAIILSGCGVYDGTEITESVSAAIHLTASGYDIAYFAPNVTQRHVVNHYTGEVDTNSTRNVLEESARIARGNIKPVSELKVEDFEGVFFPGGFGAAKNLSDYAIAQTNMQVLPEIEDLVNKCIEKVRPMSFVCISPIIAAKVLGSTTGNLKLTVGGDKDDKGKWPFAVTAEHITLLGARHVVKGPDGVCDDPDRYISSGPAYMCGKSTPNEVFDNIGSVVELFLKHMKDARKQRRTMMEEKKYSG